MAGRSYHPLQAIEAHFRESVRVKQAVVVECGEAIVRASEMLAGALRSGNKLLLCGNGGSAADSQHIAAEFVSVRDRNMVRPALAALALTTDTSFLTASANDFGFQDVFARQIEALGRKGDILLAITTSGKSANVIAALKRARANGLQTIVFTGRSGGETNDLGNVVIRVPSDSTQHIQEAHIAIGHILCELVETALFKSGEEGRGKREE